MNTLSTSDGSKRSRTRRHFSKSESTAIWTYIVKNNLHGQLGKRSTWTAMECAGVTTHSAEAMRSHYRQVLLRKHGTVDGQTTRFPRSGRKSRREFTDVDDLAMINYVVENNLQNSVNSHKIWQRMRTDLHMNHSSESMRSHFRRFLCPRLFDRSCSDQSAVVESSSSSSQLMTLNSKRSSSYVSLLMDVSKRFTNPLQVHLMVSMTTGTVAEVVNFLLTGRRRPDCPFSPPLWTPEDDAQLGTCDLSALRELIKRFGSEEVCNRIAYLTA